MPHIRIPRSHTAVTLTLGTCLSIGGCATAVAPGPVRSPESARTGTPERPASIADATFLEQYARTHRYRLGHPTELQVLPGGRSVLFLRSDGRSFERDLYAFDVDARRERLLMTADRLLGGDEEELSDAERARRERLRLAARGITAYEVSKDGKRLLVPLSGRLFVMDLQDGEVSDVRELPDQGGYANDAHLSPDGTKVACVREGNLYVIDVEAGSQRRLTSSATRHVTNGMPEFVAQEEMRRYRGHWWSPDSRHLAYQQTDTSGVEVLYAADPMHPSQEPAAAPYPRAGTPNASVRLGLVSMRGGETRWVEWDREAHPYLATVRWADEAPLTLVVQNRRQNEEKVLAVDERTGETRELWTERDEAWLNLDQRMPRWLSGGARVLWTTEREGGWQLEVRTREGSLVGSLTDPDFGYEDLVHVDEDAGHAWVLASSDPTQTHLWRVPLEPDAGQPERITTDAGIHDATFGKDTSVWIHRSETLQRGPTHVVHRGDEVIGELVSRAEDPPFAPAVELVHTGERGLRAAVVRPRNFDPAWKYPVVVQVYGGPGHRVVRARRNAFIYAQWIADHGFVVVSIDGRGTPGRGRAWERSIRGNFVDLPLADQVAGLKGLASRFPELDTDRVGIFGWSFGGYMSAMAVMRHPELFRVGVAGAPVADWRDYDTHYTERYLGLPDDNAEGYERSNVLTHAPKLERPLLVVHGTSDDNVYFTHAIKMSDALLRAGREHDFLPLSGFTHMVADPEMTEALQTRIIGFLQRHLR